MKKVRCTGCGGCISICKKKAITLLQNKKGFFEAVIDKKKCIYCGLCEKVCPVLEFPNIEEYDKKVYACFNKNIDIMKCSSSGGVFFAIAQSIILNGGIVIGVQYDENLKVKHAICDNVNDLQKFCGSKYVQSENNIMGQMLEYLKKNRTILFTGTPCQIAAAKMISKYSKLGKLFTVEVLCHGVGSPYLFDEHLNFLEKKHNSKVIQFDFRNKKRVNPSISYKLENGKLYYKDFNLDFYSNGFNRCITLNEACYECKYAKEERYSDLTIGDFWKGPLQSEIYPLEGSYPKGVSLVIVNNFNGEKLWNSISDNFYFKMETFEKAKKGNHVLTKPSTRNKLSNVFWLAYYILGYRISNSLFTVNFLYKIKFRRKK